MDSIDRDAERVLREYDRRATDPRLRSYYSRVDRAFARQRASRHALFADVLAQLGEPSSLRVIDIGCGSGIYLKKLIEAGFSPEHLFGIDLIPQDVEAARSRLPGATVLVGNAARLPFPDKVFDAALFVTVFSSIVDRSVRRRAALEAARGVSRGCLILSSDLRRVSDRNPHLRPIDESENQWLFDGIGPTTVRRHGTTLIVSSRVPAWADRILSGAQPLLDFVFAVTPVEAAPSE
jgi:SAM-dependent methyltransferase